MSEVEEIAKAVQKASELGTKTLETSEKVGGFFAQVFKEPITEVAGMLTDRLKFARWRRLVEMQEQVNKILDDRKISETRAVPPKLALPLFEEASLEDDVSLQMLWNRLLANAMDPNFVKDDLRIGFIEMIKGLTALDTKILKFFFDVLKREGKLSPIEGIILYSLKKEQIIQAINTTEADYQISAFNLMRIQCLAPAVIKTSGISFGGEATTIYKGIDAVTLTPLGVKFVQACME